MSARLGICLVLPALVGGALAACRSADRPADAPGRVVARYAGHTLREADVRAEMTRLPGSSRAALGDPERKRAFLDRVITNDLLYDEGKRLGYDADPEIDVQVEALRERLVVQRVMRDYRARPVITDDEAKAYYEANRTLFSTTQVRASHILLQDRETAEAVLAELREHPDRFDAVARQRSTDKTSAKRGGDLGLFGAGRMVEEFERAAFDLEVGALSEVVETRYGFHVITVTERREGEIRPFEAVKAQITARLANERLEKRVDGAIARLREAADVTVDDDVLSALEPPPAAAGPHAGMVGH